MIIVLIHWRIKFDYESQFLDYWSKVATIKKKDGFIGEFLSKVEKGTTKKPFPWITWHLDPESLGNAIHYVNVGMWNDESRFNEEISKHFNDDLPMKDFEKYRRRRLLIRPERYRIGSINLLPDENSEGVE